MPSAKIRAPPPPPKLSESVVIDVLPSARVSAQVAPQIPGPQLRLAHHRAEYRLALGYR